MPKRDRTENFYQKHSHLNKRVKKDIKMEKMLSDFFEEFMKTKSGEEYNKFLENDKQKNIFFLLNDGNTENNDMIHIFDKYVFEENTFKLRPFGTYLFETLQEQNIEMAAMREGILSDCETLNYIVFKKIYKPTLNIISYMNYCPLELENVIKPNDVK